VSLVNARGPAGVRKPQLTEAQIKEINVMVDAQKLPIGRIAELSDFATAQQGLCVDLPSF